MSDWNTFKNNLVSYFEENVKNTNTDSIFSQVAQKITDEYELSVLQGGDLSYNNPVATYNKVGLKTNIEQALSQGKKITNNTISQVFGNFFSLGVIQFWTGGQLAFTFFPPGTVGIVSNVVTAPGINIPTLKVSNTKNREEFIDNMIGFFEQHLQTINGITTALVPSPSGPVPIPFPFMGYK